MIVCSLQYKTISIITHLHYVRKKQIDTQQRRHLNILFYHKFEAIDCGRRYSSLLRF
jgi:hypothetical protein